jgi:mycofactocin biosynthetic radical S-adenosylmethionine protein MftC
MNYSEWPLSAPVNLTWEITHKCNLNCIHCLSASQAESAGELNLDQCKEVVDQLAGLKVFEINFGGGEPFLKDYFLDLVDYIHTKGIVTCVSTNGTLLTPGRVARLAGNPLVHVQVSLDGATAEVNDRIRGRGSYPRILAGARLLAEKGIPFAFNCVVTSQNFSELSPLRQLAGSFNAGLRVSRFRPSGRAKNSWETLRLSTSQLENLSVWLGDHPAILTGDSFFSISAKGRRELGLDMCGACKLTCCIDPVGSVYPCAFLQENDFCGGSLKRTPFKTIWDSSQAFLNFRKLEPASCKSCSRYETCRGGCPAVAYFVRGNMGASDPECLMNWTRV